MQYSVETSKTSIRGDGGLLSFSGKPEPLGSQEGAFIHPGPGTTQVAQLCRFRNRRKGHSATQQIPSPCQLPSLQEDNTCCCNTGRPGTFTVCVGACVWESAGKLRQKSVAPLTQAHTASSHMFFSLNSNSIINHSKQNPWNAKLCLPRTPR